MTHISSQTTLSKSYSFFNSSDRSATMLRTPWHNVLVINTDGSFNLMLRKKLNLKNEHIPIIFKDQLWCFVQITKSEQSELKVSSLNLSIVSRKSARFEP